MKINFFPRTDNRGSMTAVFLFTGDKCDVFLNEDKGRWRDVRPRLYTLKRPAVVNKTPLLCGTRPFAIEKMMITADRSEDGQFDGEVPRDQRSPPVNNN